MKVIDETKTTLEELIQLAQVEPTIVTRGGVPVATVLPVLAKESKNVELDRLVELIRRWTRGLHPQHFVSVDLGMVEVSMALAGFAAAIAALSPVVSGIPEILRLIVATVSSAIALLASVSALWMLARYCVPEEAHSASIIREIWSLIKRLDLIGPYSIIAIALLFMIGLSILVGILAFI